MTHMPRGRSGRAVPRLIDRLIDYRFPVTVVSHDNRRTYSLPGAADIAARLAATPLRYVLDRDVTRFCTELACRNAEVLEPCLDLVRLPARQFWVEFDEDERLCTLARETSSRSLQRHAPAGRRFGVLVIADEDLTGGVATVCWSRSAEDPHPDVSPARIEFHLRDRAAPQPADAANGVAPLAHQLACVAGLNAFARLRVEPAWLNYYKAEARTEARYKAALTALSGQMGFDWALLVSFLVCLNVKDGLIQRPVPEAPAQRRSRRALTPAQPFHIAVTASLFGQAPGAARVGDGPRGAKRLHYVRGHLVRRMGRIFWRAPHMRGNLAVAPAGTRTVRMRLNPARSGPV